MCLAAYSKFDLHLQDQSEPQSLQQWTPCYMLAVKQLCMDRWIFWKQRVLSAVLCDSRCLVMQKALGKAGCEQHHGPTELCPCKGGTTSPGPIYESGHTWEPRWLCTADLLNSRGESDEVLKWNEDMERWERVWKSSNTASMPRVFEKIFSPLTKGIQCSPPGIEADVPGTSLAVCCKNIWLFT